jgi:hypothetical protein
MSEIRNEKERKEHAMRWSTRFGLLGLSLLVAGCIPSLNSLHTKETSVFRPELVGQWEASDGDARLRFSSSQSHDDAYKLVHRGEVGDESAFLAHLTEIDGRLYIDVYPLSPNQPANEELQDINGWYRLHLVPAHTFFRVEQIKPSLKLAALNGQWVSDYLREHPDSLAHDRRDAERGEGFRFPVLTATTAELRDFIAEHADEPNAFVKPTEFQKVEPAKGK